MKTKLFVCIENQEIIAICDADKVGFIEIDNDKGFLYVDYNQSWIRCNTFYNIYCESLNKKKVIKAIKSFIEESNWLEIVTLSDEEIKKLIEEINE